jgi:hypothetical protein
MTSRKIILQKVLEKPDSLVEPIELKIILSCGFLMIKLEKSFVNLAFPVKTLKKRLNVL